MNVRHAAIAGALVAALAISAAHADSLQAKDAERVSARVLELVNEARGQGRRCGDERYSAVKPVKLSAVLARAARAHARDMARNKFFEHTGSDGSNPTSRLARTGYRWRLSGENIAYGPDTAEEVVSGWLASPGHCSNIMEAGFTEMGLAYALGSYGSKRRKALYWVQTFAAPLKP